MAQDQKLIVSTENDKNPEVLDMWKLGAFTEEVNKAFNSSTGIDAGYKTNTINNYFNDLEEQGIHVVQKINERRVFDADDLKIAVFILTKRSKELNKDKTWGLQQIYEEILNSDSLPNRKPTLEEASDTAVKELVMELQQTIIQQLENSKQTRLQISTMDQQVEKKVNNAVIAYMEQQSKVKTLAKEEWEKLPREHRFTGFIFKQEKLIERERFIDDYVEKEMYKWLLLNGNEDEEN